MFPTIQVGSTEVSSYQACLALAFVTGFGLLLYANRKALKPLHMGPLIVVPCYLGSLFGAKLMFLLIPENAAPSARVLSLWKGGYWYHGGLVGGIAAYVAYHALRRNNVIDALDLAAPFVCLGEAITRIGCFLGGCCFGAPVSGFPGVVYPHDSHPWLQQLSAGLIQEDAADCLPIHPAQLYMTLAMTALFVLLRFVARKQVMRGEIALLFFVAHCFVRFWLEFLRADVLTQFHGLSVTQWLSLAGYLVALSTLLALYRKVRAARAAVANPFPTPALVPKLDLGTGTSMEAPSWQ